MERECAQGEVTFWHIWPENLTELRDTLPNYILAEILGHRYKQNITRMVDLNFWLRPPSLKY